MPTELCRLHEPRSEIILDDSVSICLETIPGYKNWEEMRLVRRRSVSDLLFHVRDCNGDEFALRILGDRSYDYYCRCYHYQKQIDVALGIGSVVDSELDYGLCRSGQYVYFIMPWQHDRSYDSVAKRLRFDDKLKPAASAAAYIKAASSIARQEAVGKDAGLLKFADGYNSEKWLNQIDDRVAKVRRCLSSKGLDIAALEHFRRFYRSNRHLLASRTLTICYNRFAPNMWYYQPDGSIRVPLISEWSYADEWYSLNGLLTDIHAVCEDFAVLLIDFSFDFSPPEEFFICSAIYNMLNVLEQLACCSDLRSDKARKLISRLRSIDQMYSKFTSSIPTWYKQISTVGR
ncbi:MAG: hypothetical protein GX028_09540 [Clostridiaceae bacterium]|nr:hypothetical protein [Clostridiaceae bacterium]